MGRWVMKNKLLLYLALLSLSSFVSMDDLAIHKEKRNTQLVTGLKGHTKEGRNQKNYRLPRHVLPISYNIQLSPKLYEKKFTGKVTILVNITMPTKIVTLHSNKLTVNNVIVHQNKSDIPVNSFEITNDDSEFLNINFTNEHPEGMYELLIQFEGRLDNGYVGFYGSTLKNGQKMVSSKFQPTYARQAFPCFDEPGFKATYDITLIKPSSYIALSNMNEISKIHDKKTQTDAVTFATSAPMSTYLACFVICDFLSKETEINSNGIGKNFSLRSFAQVDQTHKIDFAQDIGKRTTEFYINYYDVPFPLPKLDMIAIPDYVSGATEHWGLITYRETSFLIDESTASAANKISVANTIAHEIAHMWFGNLVTMRWWDEVWLNEGFASYMQVKALNAIEPSWTMLDQFLTKTLHSVLVSDAKLSSHPIVQNVSTPDEITAIFDAISYNKGSSILRMLEGFVGEKNFQKGVTQYLKTYEFSNTITQNFLDALEPHFKEQYPDLNISYIMDTWTKQMGYPVLTVEEGDVPHTYRITQHRFLLDPDADIPNDSQFNYSWFVPVTYKTDIGTSDKILWFPDTAKEVMITLDSNATWLKINNNQVGYYRVQYPENMWLALVKQLMKNFQKFTISDRSHLLNDVFALAEAGMASYDLALNLTLYLTSEDQYVPWATASKIFDSLKDRLMNSLASTDLQTYVQRLIKPLYDQQKWEPPSNPTVIQKLLRTRILSLATKYELPDATKNARSMFLEWLNSHGTKNAVEIEPDLRTFVYYYGTKSATSDEWDKLWYIYLQEEDAQEQAKMRKGLSAPRDPNILRRYLSLAWEESNVRGQDYLNLLSDVSNNPSGTALVWDDVRSRWPAFVKRFTLNSRYLGNLIPSITDTFNTELKYDEMEAFFTAYPDAGAGEAARRSALETVLNNIKWTEDNERVVSTWLAKHTYIL